MSLIKPRTRGRQLVRHITRLDHESNETLFAYAAFISESTEYVLNQLIDAVLAKDKEFVRWRTAHPASFVGRLPARRRPTDRMFTAPPASATATPSRPVAATESRT